MKMGTMASPWRHGAHGCDAVRQPANGPPCALRLRGPSALAAVAVLRTTRESRRVDRESLWTLLPRTAGECGLVLCRGGFLTLSRFARGRPCARSLRGEARTANPEIPIGH